NTISKSMIDSIFGTTEEFPNLIGYSKNGSKTEESLENIIGRSVITDTTRKRLNELYNGDLCGLDPGNPNLLRFSLPVIHGSSGSAIVFNPGEIFATVQSWHGVYSIGSIVSRSTILMNYLKNGNKNK
ncbi:unnamed protein product, partial [Didymodactylos carnosus]